jgi:hypothetical protein
MSVSNQTVESSARPALRVREFEAWYNPKDGWVVFYKGRERIKSFALGGYKDSQAAKDNIRADLASGVYERFGYCLRNTSVHVCGEGA